jgi:DNA mismatch repair protein MutL
MPDIINLLPDSVANQIAAGEVVQRPSSVVKELLENAIDAASSEIKLIVKDSGKTLIQVTDNGKGMSETDARMCFERHATSKIKKTEDLFQIMTKGFRGEALASIAAVAQVELKTRQSHDTLGTHIEIESSKLKSQQEIQCAAGSSFIVKNLFYNVPARRYFLKSDAIELRHIIDEFQRVALTHPEIEFTMFHNVSEVFTLPAVTLRQRIVHVLGNRYNEKLVPVEESTDIVIVDGFVGKPDASKKTRGEQFFFINNRFIRNTYLNHAVVSAFQDMLPNGHFPLYLLYLQIDPGQIDINIHPTKTEIKFQDERAVYAIIHAAVRRALGRFNISPSLDFEQETAIQIHPPRAGQEINPPQVAVNPMYNPFGETVQNGQRDLAMRGWFDQREKRTEGWQELYKVATHQKSTGNETEEVLIENISAPNLLEEIHQDGPCVQLMRRYIVCETVDAMLLIDQQRAHQRVLFEQYMRQISLGRGNSQQLLFPTQIHLTPADYIVVKENIEILEKLGFTFGDLDHAILEITGVPSEAITADGEKILEEFIEEWQVENTDSSYSGHEKAAWALAVTNSVKYGQMLTMPEMRSLMDQLLRCEKPFHARKGRPTMIQITAEQLETQFK